MRDDQQVAENSSDAVGSPAAAPATPLTNMRAARSPMSLAFLFYLVTLAAILSACLRTLTDSETVTVQLMARVIIGGIATGWLIGGLSGLLYFKGWKVAILGSAVGSFVGLIAGGLALIQHSHFVGITQVAFVGCWLLIVLILVAARFQTRLSLAVANNTTST